MSVFDSLPPGIIRSAMDSYFNAILMEGFACGIYTLLVFQVVWKLYLKGGKLLYSSALVVMWISTIVSFAGDWVSGRAAFASNNGSPVDILIRLNTSSNLFPLVAGIITTGISDALIIWRCYVLWQNGIISTALIILLCTTIGFIGYADLFPNAPLDQLIQALGVISSFITTVSTTFLIALKITLVTRQSRRLHHYTKIIEILVQSAAMLSILLLVLAILILVDFVNPFDITTTTGMFCYQLNNYLLYTQLPIEGIAPTLIAFRVANKPSQTEVNSTSRHVPLSRLTFRRTTHNTNSTTHQVVTDIPTNSS